jgi:hypothetical protein
VEVEDGPAGGWGVCVGKLAYCMLPRYYAYVGPLRLDCARTVMCEQRYLDRYIAVTANMRTITTPMLDTYAPDAVVDHVYRNYRRLIDNFDALD